MKRTGRCKRAIADTFLIFLVIFLCLSWYTIKCSHDRILTEDKYGRMLQTAKSNSQNISDDKVFALDAFLVNDDEIKILTIRKCKSRKRLTLHIDYNSSSSSFTTIDSAIMNCPWFFAPKCHLVGYIATAKGIKLDFLKQANISSAVSLRLSSADGTIPLHLIEARIKAQTFNHKLAVCVQPVFLLAEWTVLIQFFETWIYHGATKFYVYFQSAAPEVDELLLLYEKDVTISVERVQWALLPEGDGSGVTDHPNENVYRGEVLAAVNDCLLRARAEAKYVISSDLDEVIVTYNKELISFVDDFVALRPKAGALVFLQQYVTFQNRWANETNPTAIDFNILANVSVERKVWPSGRRSKIVWIPEVVFKSHVHQVLQIRKGYKAMVVSSKEGAVYHFRRIESPASNSRNSDISTIFNKLIPKYNAQWLNRLKSVKESSEFRVLKKERWPNRGLKVMDEIDKCRDVLETKKKQICTAYTRCLNGITAVGMNEWIYPEQRWGVV